MEKRPCNLSSERHLSAPGVGKSVKDIGRESTHQENHLGWTVADVARELQCSPRHVRNMVSRGQIPFSKVGHLTRFCPERIREWLLKGGTR